MRGLGLKRIQSVDCGSLFQSLPVRGRGLKRDHVSLRQPPELVAPRAGAWIETTPIIGGNDERDVAPRAGAWIETAALATASTTDERRSPCGGVD